MADARSHRGRSASSGGSALGAHRLTVGLRYSRLMMRPLLGGEDRIPAPFLRGRESATTLRSALKRFNQRGGPPVAGARVFYLLAERRPERWW